MGKTAWKHVFRVIRNVQCLLTILFSRPFSVQATMKTKLSEDGKEATTQRRMMMENGHPGVEVDEAAIRRGENPYTKYYQQQGENPLPSGAQVCNFLPQSLIV